MLSYHQAFGEALKINKSEHIALFYSSNNLVINNSKWRNILEIGVLEMSFNSLIKEKAIFRAVIDVIKFAYSILKGIRSIEYFEEDRLVLFIERFNALQLAGFMLASLLKNKKTYQLLILFRHDQYSFGNSKYVYKFIIAILAKFCNLTIVTDSNILTKNLRNFFEYEVSTVPIPLGEILVINKHDDALVKIWWPGGPRENKGWKIIKEIITKFNYQYKKQNIRFVASKSSELHHLVDHSYIEILDDVLSIDSYYKKFNEINIILLPYSSIDYRASTSGIFVEAVILGKVPFVSDKTWMASELRKFDLEELIVDWERSDILEIILERYNTKEIHEKLKKINDVYYNYHNINNFSRIINSLV